MGFLLTVCIGSFLAVFALHIVLVFVPNRRGRKFLGQITGWLLDACAAFLLAGPFAMAVERFNKNSPTHHTLKNAKMRNVVFLIIHFPSFDVS